MSSTRRALKGSPIRPERWASSDQYEKGLPFLIVAKRCSKLVHAADRELIWSLQDVSWRTGLGELAARLAAAGHVPAGRQNEIVEWLTALCCDPASRIDTGPACIPDLPALLRGAVELSGPGVKPGRFVTTFGRRVRAAMDFASRSPSIPHEGRQLTLIYGRSGVGKTYEARATCEALPGRFRYVEVSAGNDDHPFYLAIATALGITRNIRYKAQELRERIEVALVGGDICLVLDEVARLWPQSNIRDNTPKKVEWVMSMAGKGVPIVLIATPQFFDSQGVAEDRIHWNSLQLERRIGHVETLDGMLPREDIQGVAAAALPFADAETIRAVTIVAAQSDNPYTAISSITRWAHYHATAAGRTTPARQDIAIGVEKAIQTSATLSVAVKRPGRSRLSSQALTERDKGRMPGRNQPSRATSAPRPPMTRETAAEQLYRRDHTEEGEGTLLVDRVTL